MKRITWLGFLCIALFLVFGVKAASADTLMYKGPAGPNSGGYYTYPYYVTVNGGAVQNMMCLDFKDDIAINPWQATAFSAAAMDKKWSTNLFEAAAYLFDLGKHGANWGDVNWAVWELFDPGVALAHGTNNADEIALLAAALGLTDAQLAAYGNYRIWVPDNFTGLDSMGTLGDQLFISDVPEPATLFLLGSGLLGLAMLLYFRKQASKQPTLSTW